MLRVIGIILLALCILGSFFDMMLAFTVFGYIPAKYSDEKDTEKDAKELKKAFWKYNAALFCMFAFTSVLLYTQFH